MLRKVLYHLNTVLLFCRSDIKSCLIPVSLLAFAATPICGRDTISRGLQGVFWALVHILQFNLSNQLYSAEEDKKNHPYRPLPNGRLSFSTAQYLRWASTVFCLLLSSWYSPAVLVTSVMSALFAFLYNEASLDKHWLFRAPLNSGGFGAFKLGAMLIVGCDRSHLGPIAVRSLAITMSIIWTTVYVQDFQDVEGDALAKRATLPLAYPALSRAAVLPLLLGWSIFLAHIWNLNIVFGALLVAFGVWVAVRFMVYRNAPADKASYAWYNLWLACCFMLPAYHRISSLSLHRIS